MLSAADLSDIAARFASFSGTHGLEGAKVEHLDVAVAVSQDARFVAEGLDAFGGGHGWCARVGEGAGVELFRSARDAGFRDRPGQVLEAEIASASAWLAAAHVSGLGWRFHLVARAGAATAQLGPLALEIRHRDQPFLVERTEFLCARPVPGIGEPGRDLYLRYAVAWQAEDGEGLTPRFQRFLGFAASPGSRGNE